jgi:hypothetical protein
MNCEPPSLVCVGSVLVSADSGDIEHVRLARRRYAQGNGIHRPSAVTRYAPSAARFMRHNLPSVNLLLSQPVILTERATAGNLGSPLPMVY